MSKNDEHDGFNEILAMNLEELLKLVFSYKYSKYEIDKNIPSPVLVIEGLQLSEYGAKTYSERSV